jgi:alkylated DNA repair dioxygenase AlkB
MPDTLPDLFGSAALLPAGLAYAAEFITADEERRLVAEFQALPFHPFEFHGYLGKRRVVSFGWRYDYGERAVGSAAPLPDFLFGLRERAAAFAGIPAEAFAQAMVTEYGPGAGIGWHRDKAVYGEVIGISFLASCPLRFRRKMGDGWERRTLTAEPRSIYLLKGPARTEWEHSIPELRLLRYSVTFRRYPAR